MRKSAVYVACLLLRRWHWGRIHTSPLTITCWSCWRRHLVVAAPKVDTLNSAYFGGYLFIRGSGIRITWSFDDIWKERKVCLGEISWKKKSLPRDTQKVFFRSCFPAIEYINSWTKKTLRVCTGMCEKKITLMRMREIFVFYLPVPPGLSLNMGNILLVTGDNDPQARTPWLLVSCQVSPLFWLTWAMFCSNHVCSLALSPVFVPGYGSLYKASN